jgi:hypothetical protein
LTPNIELHRLLDEEVGGLPFEPHEWPWHEPDQAWRLVHRLGGSDGLVADLPEGSIQADAGFASLRYTLLPSEIERYRMLGGDAAEAVEEAAGTAEPGDTELEISVVGSRTPAAAGTSSRWSTWWPRTSGSIATVTRFRPATSSDTA